MIDLGHSVEGRLSMSIKVICLSAERVGNLREGKLGMYDCSSCIQYQVYCSQILVPVSYIPLQETMKILDLMQGRTGRDCVVP